MTGVRLLAIITTLSCVFLVSTSFLNLGRGINGGTNCAGCTLVVGLLEQLADVHNETIVKALERVCLMLPAKLQTPCDVFSEFIGPIILELITQDSSPDNACRTLRFCNDDGGRQCVLFKRTQKGYSKPHSTISKFLKKYPYFVSILHEISQTGDPKICELPGIKDICLWLDDVFNRYDPAVDLDSDGFSIAETLRGTSWRGRDCDDSNHSRHPGARAIDSDTSYDSNCNGIYGKDPTTGKAYEDEFCGQSQPKGIAVLGDSVSAHFHLPEEWFDSQKLSEDVFKDIVFILENEIDWPELSTATGHVNNSWPNIVHGKMDSIYQRLYERNRCNYGDYQNIAVNVFDIWKKQGGSGWQLIEPVDGFHTNQVAQALTAQVLWDNMLKNHADFLGPVNPFNDKITQIFGNQTRLSSNYF
ncbi:hypothetical protein LOTGIDRAFT_164760 [Lottia gigantea]|uniref:Saposin B-type domain-containing protein n=1 Tax=Lottia gigantea TaxID=225164 RepID=V4BLT0_LOTGI|nr:hypothetical protein LOTGIDRAFT_164760 [Lottia gigantea]ESO89739.1 hypothetical protein LOTGIDRAFT_164760 [Lottia gigantea]